jgi:hypothetical protein
MQEHRADKHRGPVLGKNNYVRWSKIMMADLQHKGVFYTCDKVDDSPAEDMKSMQETEEKVSMQRLMEDKPVLGAAGLPPLFDDKGKAKSQPKSEVQAANAKKDKIIKHVFDQDCLMARKTVFVALDSNNIKRVGNQTHPAVIWNTLKDFHTNKSVENCQLISKKMNRCLQDKCKDMATYLEKMSDMYSELTDAGSDMKEFDFCLLLIQNLSSEFETVGLLLGVDPALTFLKCEKMLTTAYATKQDRKSRGSGNHKKHVDEEKHYAAEARIARLEGLLEKALVVKTGEKGNWTHGKKDFRKNESFNKAGVPLHERPCFSFRDSGKCSRGDKCRFSHAVEGKKVRFKTDESSSDEDS